MTNELAIRIITGDVLGTKEQTQEAITMAVKALLLPSAQPERKWIPVTERLPEDLAEVNVTWINTDPEPYYDFAKDKPATGTAVCYKSDWYWYSSITADVLAEYGRMDSEKFDDAVKVIAWMPLPEPYQAERREE